MKMSLQLFKDDDGQLRCRGRLDNSPLPYESKFPVLLPSDHHFTKLIILRCHYEVLHNGVGETLTQLRSRFWVVKGRQVVKRILSSCTVCKKMEGPSYGTPLAPPLPEFRLSNDFAFTRVGVDYAGPLYVKDIYTGDEMHKSFVALYTCASSRAIHLDLVPDASSKTFIRSLKRFIGRRGTPSLVISDNGTTFKGAELKGFLTSRGIKWNHIVERSPWWGGFYERMVKSVKRCLKKVLATSKLKYEELLTVLIEIEGVLNSRPLTYVYQDGEIPLTPSHLVLGRRLLSSPSESEEPNAMNSNEGQLVARREKYLKTVLFHFWKRWQREYLTQLREQHRPSEKKGPTASVGDVVFVQEDKVKRMNWTLAYVEKLLTGNDGKVRAAVIRYHNKAGNLAQTRRPLKKLYPVELKSKKTEQTEFPIKFIEHAKIENN